MKECVLVAGGAGYIGTHTAVELIEAGYDVVIVDNLSNSEMKAVEGVREITGRNVPFERVDCDDRQALAGVFDRYRFGANRSKNRCCIIATISCRCSTCST